MRFWASVFLFLCFGFSATAQISGVVRHERQEPLPGAAVLLLPDSIFAVTDDDGRFRIAPNTNGAKRVEVSYVAHAPDAREFAYDGKPVLLQFSLDYDVDELGAVIVEGEHGHTEEVLKNIHLEEGYVEMETKGALAQTLERVAGLSSINVGVGVSKPVIRGLSSNRIIVMTDNIKQEGQQWSSDHGLEVDQYGVEEVEILKGPASLQYGSDGLGGVLNILPEKIPEKNTVSATLLGNFRSNNLHGGGSARFAANYDNVFGSIRYSRQEFGDMTVPADSFDYLGFRLPIPDGNLKNTAGREQNISGFVGLLRSWGLTRIDVSHYSLDIGLFAGAVGIPRSYAMLPDGDRRNIDLPKQRVQHLKAVISQEVFLPNHQILHLHLGYQENLRREFSFPEFHSMPVVDPSNTMAMELRLRTYTFNGHFDHELKKTLTNTYGVDVQYQQNRRGGFELLLPDFNTFRSGVYGISRWEFSERGTLQGGVRADYGKNLTRQAQRYVYNSEGAKVDSLMAVATDDDFFNVSASAGVNYKWNQRTEMKVHFGKSFRIPYPNETVSNGVHHGTFRHEMGTPDLRSEHGYQLDVSVDREWNRFRLNVAAFFNYFDGYIYLSPSSKFSTLPEAGQIFEYKQHDAIYAGGELEWQYRPWKWFELSQAYEYVWNYNLETGLPLPFTPPGSVLSDVHFRLPDVGVVRNAYIYVSDRFVLAQNRVDRNEQTTPSYNLLSAGLGLTVQTSEKKFFSSFQLRFSVQNILNTKYFNHMSRYRWVNIPEQGRNFVVTLKVPLKVRW